MGSDATLYIKQQTKYFPQNSLLLFGERERYKNLYFEESSSRWKHISRGEYGRHQSKKKISEFVPN